MNYAEVAQGLLATVLASVVLGGFGSLLVTSRGLRRSIVGDREVYSSLPEQQDSGAPVEKRPSLGVSPGLPAVAQSLGELRADVRTELVAEMERKTATYVSRSRFPMVTMTEVIAYVFGVLTTLVLPWYLVDLRDSAPDVAVEVVGVLFALVFAWLPPALAARGALARLVRRFEFTSRFRGLGESGTMAGDWHLREARSQAQVIYNLLWMLLLFAQTVSVLLLFEMTDDWRMATLHLAGWVAADATSAFMLTQRWRPLPNVEARGLWRQILSVAPVLDLDQWERATPAAKLSQPNQPDSNAGSPLCVDQGGSDEAA